MVFTGEDKTTETDVLLFEVTDWSGNLDFARYETIDEALEGHEKIVNKWMGVEKK
jgi:hypothetical protein